MSAQSLVADGPELTETIIVGFGAPAFRRGVGSCGGPKPKARLTSRLMTWWSGCPAAGSARRRVVPVSENSLLRVSGTGKSTLLRALTGMRPADSGNVPYDNTDVYRNYARLRHRIGLVPQDGPVRRTVQIVPH